MGERPSNLSLLFGMAVSIIVHLTMLVPLMLMAMTSSKQPGQARAELPAEEIVPPEKDPEREEPALGIEQGTPSSVSWVGYEEYEEHLAQLAEMEQAAFTREPSGAMGVDDVAHAADVEPREDIEREPADADEHEAEMAEVIDVEDAFTAAPEPVDIVTLPEPAPRHVVPAEIPVSIVDEGDESLEAEVPAITEDDVVEADLNEPADADEQVGEYEDESAEAPADEVADVAVDVEEVEPVEQAEDVEHRESAREDSEAESESEPEVDSAEQSDQTDEPREPQHDAPPGEVRDGEVSDRDADAMSVIDVPRENWRLGRPLAAEGVEIKPERPHFTLLQLMTGLPRNPIVLIRFNNGGVPEEAAILRTSGDQSIDAAIVASLYRWRAEGEAIDALDQKQTFDIQIRIVLVHRRGAG